MQTEDKTNDVRSNKQVLLIATSNPLVKFAHTNTSMSCNLNRLVIQHIKLKLSQTSSS